MSSTTQSSSTKKIYPQALPKPASDTLEENGLHPLVNQRRASDTLSLLIVFRFINALCVRTFFQPDEYFQSLEPAWQMAFGSQSGAWITWEWQHQLRSSLHPAFFAVIYLVFDKLMVFTSCFPQFRAMILSILPNVAQGLFAAAGDYYTWKLGEKLYGLGSNTAWVALLMSIFSPWQWFCSTRTFSNSLEMTLTIIALYYWPWDMTVGSKSKSEISKGKASAVPSAFQRTKSLNNLRLSLLLASLACILRPTNLLIWTNVIMPTITRLIEPRFVNLKDYLILARECVICGLAVILVSGLSDRLYFGEWTFPPYQWYHFNVSQGLAGFYGRNVWHYYFSQGLPLLLTTYLPFALYALYILVINIRSPSKSIYVAPDISFILTNTLYSTLITFSLISHKEVRFIYPLLPILHILIAPTVTNYFYTKSTRKIHPPPFPSAPQTERITVTRHKKSLYLLLILNIAIPYYTTQIHQSGVLSVQTFLRQEYERLVFNGSAYPIPSSLSNGEETFVAYLMPCHSVPWRSSLAHSNLTAWALTCEPPLSIPLNTPEREAYRDEADRFYDDPEKFLREEVGGRERPWPRFVVGFQGIEEGLRKWYEANNKGWEMREKWRGKNSDWHDDWRRQGDVVVWEFGIAN